MNRVADRLRNLAPEQVLRGYTLLTVVALDGSQVRATDGTTTLTYQCLSGYTLRQPGDVVLAVQLAGGAWVVLGRVGAPPLPPPAPAVALSNSTSAPSGSGWMAVRGEDRTLWLRTGPDGAVDLHVQTLTPEPPA